MNTVSKKKCVFEIKNTDNLCLLRAFLLCKAVVDKDPDVINLKKQKNKLTFLAQELSTALNFDSQKPCGIPEIKILDQHFKDYQLMILDANCETIYLDTEKDCHI